MVNSIVCLFCYKFSLSPSLDCVRARCAFFPLKKEGWFANAARVRLKLRAAEGAAGSEPVLHLKSRSASFLTPHSPSLHSEQREKKCSLNEGICFRVLALAAASSCCL
jgi:hypothetical protein